MGKIDRKRFNEIKHRIDLIIHDHFRPTRDGVYPEPIGRDGNEITVGAEVETNFHRSCIGKTFVVDEIHPWNYCSSRFLVLVHLKDFPERKLSSKFVGCINCDGVAQPDGIDTGWFELKKNEL